MDYRIVAYIEAIALIIVIAGFAAYALLFTPGQPRSVTLSGAGATFPAPLIQLWTEEFYELTGVQVNYEGIGSGGGIKQHTEKTVDYGASDPPMKEDEWTAAPGTLHVPITIGGVAVVYNIPGIATGLNFTGEVIANIFSQTTTRWNDQSLVDLNPSVTLPDQDIVVCHRSDSSGTTMVFTSFLAAESGTWSSTYGASKVINWPEETLGGKGNPGVAALVQQNDYSIGYVELSYATENDIPYGTVENAAGKFILPSMEALASAAGAASLVLPPGDESWASVGSFFNLRDVAEPNDGYPITSFSYILVYEELDVIPGMTPEKAEALTQFLWWATRGGQYYSPSLNYVPLPQEVITHNEATLQMITFDGQQLLD